MRKCTIICSLCWNWFISKIAVIVMVQVSRIANIFHNMNILTDMFYVYSKNTTTMSKIVCWTKHWSGVDFFTEMIITCDIVCGELHHLALVPSTQIRYRHHVYTVSETRCYIRRIIRWLTIFYERMFMIRSDNTVFMASYQLQISFRTIHTKWQEL